MVIIIEEIVNEFTIEILEPVSEDIILHIEEIVTEFKIEVVEPIFTAQKFIYEVGEIQVFKTKLKTDLDYEEGQQIGDWCIGFIEGRFINAPYIGGDKLLLTSYNI